MGIWNDTRVGKCWLCSFRTPPSQWGSGTHLKTVCDHGAFGERCKSCGVPLFPHGNRGSLGGGQLLPQRAEPGSDGVQCRAAQGQCSLTVREKVKEAFNSLSVPVTPCPSRVAKQRQAELTFCWGNCLSRWGDIWGRTAVEPRTRALVWSGLGAEGLSRDLQDGPVLLTRAPNPEARA